MNILFIAKTVFLKHIRDKKSLIGSIIMPLLMLVIIGSVMKSFMDVKNIDKVNVAFVNDNGSEISSEFNSFLNRQEVKNSIDVRKVNSIDEGKKLLQKSVVTAVLYIKKGNTSKIEMLGNSHTDYRNSIVENLISAFADAGNTAEAVYKLNGNSTKISNYEGVSDKEISIEGKRPKAMDYWAVIILVLSIMNSASLGVASVGEDYFQAVSSRMKSSPLCTFERMCGKILGCVFSIFIQSITIIIITKLIFNINWGNNLLLLAFIIFSSAILSTAFGSLICMITGSVNKAASIIVIQAVIFTTLVGALGQTPSSSIVNSVIFHISPNFYAQTALFDYIYKGIFKTNVQFFSFTGYIIPMWVISVILFLLADYIGRRKIA